MNNSVPKILYTFDVEVFFGHQSGCASTCILENTLKTARILAESNISGVYFIDASHMWYAHINGEKEIVQLFKLLIKELRDLKQDIGLHLHTHWLNASGCNPDYVFTNLSNYSVAQAGKNYFDEISRMIEYFKQEVYFADPEYTVNIFRAGGYCGQPFEYLAKILHSHSIYIDSSVVPNFHVRNNPFSFDYRSIKNSNPYKFTSDITKPIKNGYFTELPVYSYWLTSPRRMYEKIKRKLFFDFTPYHKGKGLMFDTRTIHRFLPTHKILTTDDCSLSDVVYALKQSQSEYVILVNHPKLLSRSGEKTLKQVTKVFDSLSLQHVQTLLHKSQC